LLPQHLLDRRLLLVENAPFPEGKRFCNGFIVTRLRKISQAAFFLLFLYLLTGLAYPPEGRIPPQIFLRFDPLHFITLLAASRPLGAETLKAIFSFFFVSLSLLFITFFLGRVFCGWVCPLGTTFDIADRIFIGKFKQGSRLRIRLRNLKYLVLLVSIIVALGGAQVSGWLDPLSFATRLYALGFFPAGDYFVRAILTPFAKSGRFPWAGNLLAALNENLFYFKPPVFHLSVLFLVLFAILIFADIFERRFFCRNICPLGALFGLLSRWNLLSPRVKETCVDCGRCEKICPTGAIEQDKGKLRTVHPSECIGCLACAEVCPAEAIELLRVRRTKPAKAPDLPGRRAILSALLVALAGIPFLRRGARTRSASDRPIRPPGALPEEEFLRRCLRCGECMRVCPENALQPTFGESGLEGLWTPMLVPSTGYCLYTCGPQKARYNNLCGVVCPSGAIRKLSLEEKHTFKIGTAYIDRSRCIPWAQGISCGVCEEHCPVPGKAIVQRTQKVQAGAAGVREVLLPYVIPERCIGCGICENKCPVEGLKAIRVARVQT